MSSLPSLPPLPPHFFRFTFKSIGDCEHLVHWLQCLKGKFIVCQETGHNSGEKEHLHVLSFADKKEQQFRRLFKQQFPEYSGNEDFAFTSLGQKGIYTINDIKDTEQYICKGISENEKPNIIAMLGYTELDIVQAHTNYWIKNNQIQTTIKIKGEKKAKKIQEKTWTEKVVQEWKSQNEDFDDYTIKGKVKVVQHVLSMFRKEVKGFDNQILKRACNAIWNSMTASYKVQNNFLYDTVCSMYPDEVFHLKYVLDKMD